MRRWLMRRWLLVSLGVALLVVQLLAPLRISATPALAPALDPARAQALPHSHLSASIPIEQQPFYGQLEEVSRKWSDVVLDQVVGDSPRATLINFYAVMAEVGHRSQRLSQPATLRREQLSDAERREQIDDTDLLFHLAVKALDASSFPESVRTDMAEEAAIQLKHVLDYVFTHSRTPLAIPDALEMRQINDRRASPADLWRIPGTAIALTSVQEGDPENKDYLFSAETVASIGEMYREIRDYPVIAQPFATPNFYKNFVYTPGYLVPPGWYLAFSPSLRRMIELPIWGQTVFQIACAFLALVIFLILFGWLSLQLLNTYRRPASGAGAELASGSEESGPWKRDAIAWRRFLLALPILPLTRFAKYLIDDVVNFTGMPLVVFTYLFFVIWYLAAGFLAFYFFEAVGRSSSEVLARMRGGSSNLQLQRITNFVMPLCRAIGALASVALGYRLLIVLGLPASTVLAFSAVPGLAIGLGASKLLGNLFAGLSIQTDRPLRVGEFCRVGDNLGYITKIGLRSLELQTLESRVTIPNAVAEDATIVNYSLRDRRGQLRPMQGLELRLQLEGQFSPFQLEQLLTQTRRFLATVPELQHPLVTLERRAEDGSLGLIAYATVALHGWEPYLTLREQLLVRLEELVERAQLSEIPLGLSYSTTPEQLQAIPALMREVVEHDPALTFHSCRMERIAAFSYDHVLEFSASHLEHDDFEESLHDLNRRIIEALALRGIEIPFPTQTLMVSSSDAADA
ncbi:mechanosensitive ion channel family protein [Vulcanococcus sp.]|uniref:mechanosensitive ion channel family protein n=1 Tax=Vulcanococcus sp. TaxID=2856995 RepID=UPI003BFEF80A